MKRLLFLILSLLLFATQAIPAVIESRKELYVFNESSNCELSDEEPLSMHCTSESSMELSDTDAQYKPILLWATSLMRSSYKGTTWHINRTGGTYSFPAYMHCMVLVGYNEAERVYYFNDPYKSRGLVAYDMELVETRFKELGSQALALMHRNDYKAEKTDVSQGMVYAIRNAETGKYVTTINVENIIQSTFKNDASQLFTMQKNSDGSICFINVKTNTALAASYLDIQIGALQAKAFQSFEISYVENGFMRISLAKDPSIALTVCGNYNGEGGNTSSLLGNVYLSNATESHLLYEYWELVPVEMP